MDELDALIRSLYENSVLGKIPERQYQRLMAQYDEEQAVCEARIAELKKELDVVETTKVDLKRFIKLIRKYKDCETLTDEMLYELVEKVVIHSASGGRTIYRQQQIDIYFNFIGDTFPSQIEISRGDKKNLTEQQLAKRKKYQKTAGENRKRNVLLCVKRLKLIHSRQQSMKPSCRKAVNDAASMPKIKSWLNRSLLIQSPFNLNRLLKRLKK